MMKRFQGHVSRVHMNTRLGAYPARVWSSNFARPRPSANDLSILVVSRMPGGRQWSARRAPGRHGAVREAHCPKPRDPAGWPQRTAAGAGSIASTRHGAVSGALSRGPVRTTSGRLALALGQLQAVAAAAAATDGPGAHVTRSRTRDGLLLL